MKKIHFIIPFVLVFFLGDLCAQDTINLVNSDILPAKVVEITANQVKYKKTSNLSGPIYTLEKREVAGIQYENGEVDRFIEDRQLSSEYKFFKRSYFEGITEIGREEFENILKVDTANFTNYKKGVNLRSTGYVILIPAMVTFTYAVFDYPWGQIGVESNAALMKGSGLVCAGAIGLYLLGDSKANKSLQSHNNATDLGLNMSINQNGIGMVLRF